MRIRNGFVSNSSSSSFCIFGLDSNQDINKLLGALGLQDPSNIEDYDEQEEAYEVLNEGIEIGPHLFEFVMTNGEIYYCGVSGTEILKELSIKDAGIELSELLFDRYGVQIHPDHFRLHYGEISDY